MIVYVLAKPNAKFSSLIGWRHDPQCGRVLQVRIAAPPVDGKANAAIRAVLAESLRVAPSLVQLKKGGSSRYKVFSVPDHANWPELPESQA